MSGNPFVNGQAVNYDAPDPLTFSSLWVDVAPTKNDDDTMKPVPSDNNHIYFVDADGKKVAHGLTAGNLVTYRLVSGSPVIGGLTSGRTYRVAAARDNWITLKNNDVVTVSVRYQRLSGGGATVIRDSGSWLTDGFGTNSLLSISSSGTHDGTAYVLTGVTATQLTIQAVGATFQATRVYGSMTFTHVGSGDGDRDTITRGDGRNWGDDGFAKDQQIVVSGAGANSGTFVVHAVSGTVLTITTHPFTTGTSATATVDRAPVAGTFDQPVLSLTPNKGGVVDSNGDRVASPTNLAAAQAVHEIVRAPYAAIGGLTDATTYYVRDLTVGSSTSSFRLAAASGGAALALSTIHLASAAVHWLRPVADLSATSEVSRESLRIDITTGTTTGSRLVGPGGVPLATTLLSAGGDGTTTATSAGSGGAAVSYGTNKAVIVAEPSVAASVAATLLDATGHAVSISTNAALRLAASSRNSTGAAIGLAYTDSSIQAWTVNEASVAAGAQIVADDVSLSATTTTTATGSNNAKAGAGIAVANAESGTILVDYATTATVGAGASVVASDTVDVEASSSTNAQQDSVASGLGFGADGRSDAIAKVGESGVTDKQGATTQVEIGAGATVTARSVALRALVPEMTVKATSKSYGAGFYSEGVDEATVEITSNAKVLLDAGAIVTGLEGVDLQATYESVDTNADSFARSTGLFGYVHAVATNDTNLASSVSGASGALVTAGARDASDTNLHHPSSTTTGATNLAFYVELTNHVDAARTWSATADGHVSKRSLAGGSGSESAGPFLETPISVPFSSDLVLLAGAPPVLHVDGGENGAASIAEAVGITVNDGAGRTQLTSGAIQSASIVVNDIANPGVGDVVFRAPAGTISGSGGTWTFPATLREVRIVNESDKPLILNDIRVVASRGPIVWLDPTATDSITFCIQAHATGTLVDVRNLGAGSVTVNGTIDNPLGTTSIVNTGGSILSSDVRGHVHLGSLDGTTAQPLLPHPDERPLARRGQRRRAPPSARPPPA